MSTSIKDARSTMLHYAQLQAQMDREKAQRDGDMFYNIQCRKCGLFHANAKCHPYMDRLQRTTT